jgi:hypothetical protein
MLLLCFTTSSHSVSAAMIGTDKLLKPDHNQITRDETLTLMAHDEVREFIVAQGINPREAKVRIDSLSDAEIELISEKRANLPAGGSVTGFVLIVGGVILAVILIVEYTSEIKMFPGLTSTD